MAAGGRSAPPLWMAERGDSRVFLFGQMPVKATTPWLTPAIESTFQGCRELWTENPDVDPAAANASIRKIIARGGPSVAQILPVRDLERLHAVLETAGQKPGSMDGAPASLAYLQISNLADMASGTDPAAIPERVLKSRAKVAGKPVHSEWASFDEAAQAMAPATAAAQLQLIRKALDDAEGAPSSGHRLAAWMAGDLTDQEAEDGRLRRLYPDLYARLQVERNRAWAPRLMGVMAEPGACFVCVGFGHLVGPHSIQSYLTKTGLDVRRV